MKIICIGRNYANHAAELGNKVPEKPMFFLKPDSAILPKKHAFYIPNWSDDVQYEVELVVKICRLGRSVEERFASRYYSKVGLGIDFTARDVQSQLKEKGHPWEMAKAFDGSAVICEPFESLEDLGGDVQNLNFELKKNGEVVQSGNSGDMIFPVNDIIVYVSNYMTLKMGDLIFTGTPAGVGKVVKGDLLEGFLEGKLMFSVRIR